MEIFHRNSLVGKYVNPIPDMWYLEGKFDSEQNDHSKTFLELVKDLEIKACLEDPTKGIRVQLKNSEADNGSLFIVMSYTDEILFGRQVVDAEAIEWALKNVPE